jgi:type IV secretory pathway VirD2 relaxase
MTVEELKERMTLREMTRWDERFALEREAAEKAAKRSEQATTQRR